MLPLALKDGSVRKLQIFAKALGRSNQPHRFTVRRFSRPSSTRSLKETSKFNYRDAQKHLCCSHVLRRGANAYPVTYEPSLNVFVEGRKRLDLGGMRHLGDESTFLLTSFDWSVMNKVLTASEEVPLLSLLLKFDMAVVRNILSQDEFQVPELSSQDHGIAIG